MKLSIIVPCYNEEEGLPHLFKKLDPVIKDLKKTYKVELIYVDDGSKDNTYQILTKHYNKRKDVKILRHKKNKNLGAALRTAFKNSTGDIIVPIDSDCTYPPIRIKKLINLLDKDTDIVTGSPYHPKGHVDNVPPYRLFLSKSISKIYSILLRANIYTYTAIFRAYKKEVIKKIKFKSDDFLSCAEILIYAILKGYKVKEFPTTLYSRKYGQSNIRLLQVILSHAKFICKVILIRLRLIRI